MAPSFCIDINESEKGQLLGIARRSIESGLAGGSSLRSGNENLAGSLSIRLGAFVTLTLNEVLRGCVGSLESTDPLAQAVANSAFKAAFSDSRFAPLEAAEIEDTRIKISVLSELEPLAAVSRTDLLDRLRPGEDGLLLQDRDHRATFLPGVWDKISDPEEFLGQLLVKAGLPGDYWSESISFKRYRALSFGE